MAGAGSRPEHQVICQPPRPDGRGDELLRFTVDGQEKTADLHIGALSDQLVASLPDLVIDLLEVATFVYAIDASVSRGGPVDARMGSAWHRRFAVKCPVRCPEIWGREDVCRALETMLMALSGDRFRFEFVPNPDHAAAGCYFDLGAESGWVPDAVLLFSGGLDSFAGALEEIVERKNRVALISHHSSTKIAKVQRELQATLQKRLGKTMLMHIPTRVNLGRITNAEGSHRTRSFLFAALGMATAIAFRRC